MFFVFLGIVVNFGFKDIIVFKICVFHKKSLPLHPNWLFMPTLTLETSAIGA
jgi:hypothetical protein